MGKMNRIFLMALLVALAASCDSEIGDSCSANVDCSSNGDRQIGRASCRERV